MKTHKYLNEILFICKNKHLSAEEVLNKIRKKYPKIGLATVYRNLEFLVKKKQMRKIINVNKISYYETIISPHIHFIDKKTGKIYDISFDSIKIEFDFPVKISDVKIIGEKLD